MDNELPAALPVVVDRHTNVSIANVVTSTIPE